MSASQSDIVYKAYSKVDKPVTERGLEVWNAAGWLVFKALRAMSIPRALREWPKRET